METHPRYRLLSLVTGQEFSQHVSRAVLTHHLLLLPATDHNRNMSTLLAPTGQNLPHFFPMRKSLEIHHTNVCSMRA